MDSTLTIVLTSIFFGALAVAIILAIIFRKKPIIKKWLFIGMSAVTLICYSFTLVPTVVTFVTPYKMTTAPVVFDSGDTYSIMWATTHNASAKVEITSHDGSVVSFSDATDGLGKFNKKIHRVDVDKKYLSDPNSSYRVSSKKTISTKGFGYKMGKEITSANYNFIAERKGEEINILSFSDIQGGAKYARKALKNITQEIDFVLLLGDYSDVYNKNSEFITPILEMAAIASKSSKPCLYVTGNHEYRGSRASELSTLFPTPSPQNKRYFTYTYKDLFLTALDFADDHTDSLDIYSGLAEFNDYRDEQYNWLKNEVVPKRESENYRYNLAASHIPIVNNENLLTSEIFCKNCDKNHGYKLDDFQSSLEEMRIDMLISAHTHSEPRIVTSTKCAFPNMQVGSVARTKAGAPIGYRNSIITLKDGVITYQVYRDK